MRRSLLSSWYPPAQPDPAGLSRQRLLRNLCKERDRSETVRPQTPSRIQHPPGILPTAGMAPAPPSPGEVSAPSSRSALGPGGLQRDLSNLVSKNPKDGAQKRPRRRTRVGWARRCSSRRRRRQQRARESLFLRDTPDFFFFLLIKS